MEDKRLGRGAFERQGSSNSRKTGPDKRRKEKSNISEEPPGISYSAIMNLVKGRSQSHKKKPIGIHTKTKSYKFKDIARIVSLLANGTQHCRSYAVRAAEENSHDTLMSLQQIRQIQRTAGSREELLFDAGYYSSAASKNKYVRLPAAARATLTLPSPQRSRESLQHVHKLFLQMKLLFQYPHQIQIELCRVGFFSSFSASRVIIRQGHHPFYFYIIISGSVLVNEMALNEETGEMFATTMAILEKGAQFGETALLLNNVRNATVVAQSDVELLVIDKSDFLPLFDAQIKDAQGRETPEEIEHIQFLMTEIEAFRRFPARVLQTSPMNCVVHYFRKGSVIVSGIDTEWLYVIKSGSCRVVSAVPVQNHLKEQARDIIECLRKNGYDEIDIYDLQFNSIDQIEHNSKIRDFIETPNMPRSRSPLNRSRSSTLPTSPLVAPGIACPEPPPSFPRSRGPSTYSSRRDSTASTVVSQVPSSNQDTKVCMFVCVKILKPGDTFGFESLVSETPDIPLSVVSNNAEVIVVSKKLYQKFVPPDILISLKARFQNFPYPRSQDIIETLNCQWQWYSYKKQVLRNTLNKYSSFPVKI